MVSIWGAAGPNQRPSLVKRALCTERCQDTAGRHFNVIVWRDWPGPSITSYSLEDGTPVEYHDECYFKLPSGKTLTRCEH